MAQVYEFTPPRRRRRGRKVAGEVVNIDRSMPTSEAERRARAGFGVLHASDSLVAMTEAALRLEATVHATVGLPTAPRATAIATIFQVLAERPPAEVERVAQLLREHGTAAVRAP